MVSSQVKCYLGHQFFYKELPAICDPRCSYHKHFDALVNKSICYKGSKPYMVKLSDELSLTFDIGACIELVHVDCEQASAHDFASDERNREFETTFAVVASSIAEAAASSAAAAVASSIAEAAVASSAADDELR